MATQLDHIILLLSPADFNNVPSWLSDNFTIIDGGKHSRGTSQNKLIIFQDGTYIELFSWVDPQPENVEPHADFPSWAKKPESHIIDWALTGPDAHGKYDEVMSQIRDLEANGAQLGVTYDEPKEGGRRRMDGRELRWYATRPRQSDNVDNTSRFEVPFFCHDISDRALRVPYIQGSTDDWPSIITHPCGAIGVHAIAVKVPASQTDICTKLYEGILGTQRDTSDDVGSSIASYRIASPAQAIDTSVGAYCEVYLLDHNDSRAQPDHQAGTSIQQLMLRTNNQDRKNEQINAEGFATKITLY